MTDIQFKNYKRAAMKRVTLFLKKKCKEIPRKQNQQIREFARLNSLTIPTNKSNIDWLIELYLSKTNENCSQSVPIERCLKAKPSKTTKRFDDEIIQVAKEIDEALDMNDGRYIKMKYVIAYLCEYRGYFQQDLDEIESYVQTNDLLHFINNTPVNHGKYLKSLKWAQIKDYVRERDNYRCSDCGKNMADDLYNLHTHHLTYDRLGDENPDTDLVLLCNKCHQKEHSKK